MDNNSVAILSSEGEYTSFTVGDTCIRFRTSTHLERYTGIKKWNYGYIEVMAKYDTMPEDEEEYIDLRPILDNLFIDKEHFLRPIQEVKIQYA